MIGCIGDSFTYGAELPDAQLGPSSFAWPNVLEQKLAMSTVNFGEEACSNQQIISKTVDCVLSKKFYLIIIAWTDPNRINFIDQQGVFSVWPGRNTSLMADNRQSIVKYLAEIHNDNSDGWYYRNWLKQILLLQNLLKNYNQKYLMLMTFQIQELNRKFMSQNQDLITEINFDKWLGWPYEGIVEWAHGTQKGPKGHFLEHGHQKVANKIYEHIRNFSWLS